MQLNITGRHVEVTPSIRDYVNEKADRLKRYFDGIVRLQVTLNVEGDRHIAYMILGASRGVTLVGEEVAGDLYAAVDLVVDKLGRQLKRHKAKLRNGRRHGTRRDGAVTFISPEGEEEDLLSYQDAVDEGID